MPCVKIYHVFISYCRSVRLSAWYQRSSHLTDFLENRYWGTLIKKICRKTTYFFLKLGEILGTLPKCLSLFHSLFLAATYVEQKHGQNIAVLLR